MINAPVLVFTAAGLSAIAKAKTHTGTRSPGELIQFWGSIVLVSGGLLVLDRFASNVAAGLAALWIVGGILVNGSAITEWLRGVSKGVNLK